MTDPRKLLASYVVHRILHYASRMKSNGGDMHAFSSVENNNRIIWRPILITADDQKLPWLAQN